MLQTEDPDHDIDHDTDRLVEPMVDTVRNRPQAMQLDQAQIKLGLDLDQAWIKLG